MKTKKLTNLILVALLSIFASACVIHPRHGHRGQNSRGRCAPGKAWVQHKGKWKCKNVRHPQHRGKHRGKHGRGR